MAPPKRTGGPKTAQGKAVSARNSLQHGLRSRAAVPGPEQQAMDAQVAQLTAYYRPRSPLETLQIQRIARCAAKLNTLYAVEKAKTALALLGSRATDDQAMLQFAHYPAAARNLALELMQPSQTKPKFGLTDILLNQLCQEIDDFAGVLERSGPACLNNISPSFKWTPAGCQRCRVIHGGERRLRRTQSRGG